MIRYLYIKVFHVFYHHIEINLQHLHYQIYIYLFYFQNLNLFFFEIDINIYHMMNILFLLNLIYVYKHLRILIVLQNNLIYEILKRILLLFFPFQDFLIALWQKMILLILNHPLDLFWDFFYFHLIPFSNSKNKNRNIKKYMIISLNLNI